MEVFMNLKTRWWTLPGDRRQEACVVREAGSRDEPSADGRLLLLSATRESKEDIVALPSQEPPCSWTQRDPYAPRGRVTSRDGR